MVTIFTTYIGLAIKEYYWWHLYKLVLWNFMVPLTITIVLYYYLGSLVVVKIFSWSSQELINAFSIISWFLLSSISIILATTEVNKKNMPMLRTNLGTNDEWVKTIINNLKKILLYEVWIQFILIIIITILISVTKIYTEIKVLSFLTLLIWIISFTLILKLLKNFLKFENITSFNLVKE